VFARVATFGGSAEQTAEALAVFDAQVMPWLREASGFRGFVALLDRENERSLGITFWADEETARDAGGLEALRDDVARMAGTEFRQIDLYEVATVDSLALK
jgi:heme-degrading monooxygenase HmoA